MEGSRKRPLELVNFSTKKIARSNENTTDDESTDNSADCEICAGEFAFDQLYEFEKDTYVCTDCAVDIECIQCQVVRDAEKEPINMRYCQNCATWTCWKCTDKKEFEGCGRCAKFGNKFICVDCCNDNGQCFEYDWLLCEPCTDIHATDCDCGEEEQSQDEEQVDEENDEDGEEETGSGEEEQSQEDEDANEDDDEEDGSESEHESGESEEQDEDEVNDNEKDSRRSMFPDLVSMSGACEIQECDICHFARIIYSHDSKMIRCLKCNKCTCQNCAEKYSGCGMCLENVKFTCTKCCRNAGFCNKGDYVLCRTCTAYHDTIDCCHLETENEDDNDDGEGEDENDDDNAEEEDDDEDDDEEEGDEDDEDDGDNADEVDEDDDEDEDDENTEADTVDTSALRGMAPELRKKFICPLCKKQNDIGVKMNIGYCCVKCIWK